MPGNSQSSEGGINERAYSGENHYIPTAESQDLNFEQCNTIQIHDISIYQIMKCKESMLALIAVSLSMYNISCITPFLSVELKGFNLDNDKIAYCFMLCSFPYFFAAISLPFLLKNCPRKL